MLLLNLDTLSKAMDGIDYVAHLASIVGDPACAKDPDLTRDVNLKGAFNTYDASEKAKVKKFVFASTCSNYGKMKDPNSYVDETSEINPISLYAETKVEFENYLLNQPKDRVSKPTCLRFSTVYGLSPRIRFDLTVNEFTKELALGRELVIFGEQFWRPYCHVYDLSMSVVKVFECENNITDFNVYNVGNTSENYQKKMIVDEIIKEIPDSKIKYVKKDEDPRDYRVSFKKINNDLGFNTSFTVPDGIKQTIKAIRDKFINDPDSSKYKNI